MSHVTIPNRPLGTDVRSIEAILADFDVITAVINGGIDETNLVAGLQSLTTFDGQTRQIIVRSFVVIVNTVPPGWSTQIFNFTAFPTSCIHAFGILGPINNGANLISWGMGSFNNGSISFFTNLAVTDNVRCYGMAWGY